MSQTPDTPQFVDQAQRYKLVSRIATGGMGEVWRAEDTVLGRAVAVKLLKREYADDASFRTRFESEARNAAALHHPNVAAVFDFGQVRPSDGGDTPRPYLVMELVNGKPLSDLIRRGNPMDPDAMRELLAQAADAIGAAHAAGIVHRDVKPANLLVTPDRRVKITDFGIARATEGMALTQTGQVMGTPQYLSPEQAQGRGVTPASDVYSLGVVAFECLAGRRPFEASSSVATALAHVREPVPDLPDDVPADLAAVVYKTMEKDPEDRYADGRELAAALRDPATAATMITGAGATGGSTAMLPGAAAGAGLGAAAGAVAGAAAARGSQGDDPADNGWDDGSPATRGQETRVQDTRGGAGAGGTGTTSGWAGEVDAEEKKDRSSSRVWLWVLLAVAAVVVVLLLLTQLGGDDGQGPGEPTPSETAPSQTQEPSQEPTEEQVETVDVQAGDYVGRQVDDAAADLQGLGLSVQRSEVGNPGGENEGEVTSVNPTGTLQQGDSVTLEYYGAEPEPTPEPTPTPTPTPTSPPTPSSPTTQSSSQGPTDAGSQSPSAEETAPSDAPTVSRAGDEGATSAPTGGTDGAPGDTPGDTPNGAANGAANPAASGSDATSRTSASRPLSRGDR